MLVALIPSQLGHGHDYYVTSRLKNHGHAELAIAR